MGDYMCETCGMHEGDDNECNFLDRKPEMNRFCNYMHKEECNIKTDKAM
jgi:hypothetical protein